MAAVLFFDTETTGMVQWHAGPGSLRQPYIMQLGAILQDAESRKIMQEMNFLVRLPEGVEPEPKAVEIHKITPEMCARYGYGGPTVFRLFELMCEKADTIVAHNLKFDAFMWEIECLRHTFVNPDSFRRARAFCTMMSSTGICKIPGKFAGQYKWPTLKEATQLLLDELWDDEGAHDAMYDVRKCQAIYWKLQDRLNSL